MRQAQRKWPLVVKVPLIVAVLMVFAAAIMSSVLLLRLGQEQRGRIEALGDAYLDATSAALAPALDRRDVWEAFDILDRSRRGFATLRLRLAAAVLPDGTTLAATDPLRLPTGTVPGPDIARPGGSDLEIEESEGLAWASRPVVESGIELGRVLVEIDVSDLWQERLRLGLVLVGVNGGVALAMAGWGWWLVRRMLRPVRLLTEQLGRGASGVPRQVAPAAYASSGPEFAMLFGSYNAMVRAAGEREALTARLAEEERMSTLGVLAGSMAHEVNNPLGGMLTALDTIAEHGADDVVRVQSVGFLRRGLEDIRNVVRSSLVLYRTRGESTPFGRDTLDDLKYLAGPEAARRGVLLEWRNTVDAAPLVDGTAVRQAVLNLVLNAVAASPPGRTVCVHAELRGPRLVVTVADEGPGLPPAMAAILDMPTAMPPAGSRGLGLWTAARAARSLDGRIRRQAGFGGTILVLEIPAPLDAAAGARMVLADV